MLRLLPPVCRDCGRSGEKVPLSRYLDFKLCETCVERRERAMRTGTKTKSKRVPGRKKEKAAPAKDELSPERPPKNRNKP